MVADFKIFLPKTPTRLKLFSNLV